MGRADVGGAGAGVAGAGGVGGTGSAGGWVMGSAGLGGGGAGGGPCASDAACGADKGEGSLCVGDACTAPTTSCAKGTLVVVPDEAFAGELAAELDGACVFRALGPALAVAAAPCSGTTRVAVYAATVEGPAAVPSVVQLEGRATASATLVALTTGGASGAGGGGAGASGAGGAGVASAFVTLGDGAALASVAPDDEGAVGVRVAAGKASLEGPLELRGSNPALSVEGSATGKADAAVLFTGNSCGVRVGPTASQTMAGDKNTTQRISSLWPARGASNACNRKAALVLVTE